MTNTDRCQSVYRAVSHYAAYNSSLLGAHGVAVCLQCKICVIHTRALQNDAFHLRRYTNVIPLPFTFLQGRSEAGNQGNLGTSASVLVASSPVDI